MSELREMVKVLLAKTARLEKEAAENADAKSP